MQTPEKLRFIGVQNVTINLPNCALVADKDLDKFYKELRHRIKLAVIAHENKTAYLEKIMAVSNSPLKFINNGMDGEPYNVLREGSYLIGILGLNEAVYNLIGQELHESQEAYALGLQIISVMKKEVDTYSKENNMNIKLEETPAESTAMRFATLDKKRFGDAAY
jgi:ribonucleoside-triphosphate reductase